MYTRVLHMTSTNWRRTNKEELILVDKNLLRHLAKKYPDVKSATEEIVNRNAILSLPKVSEYPGGGE